MSRKRRPRTPHSGVKLLEIERRSGTTKFVARWTDPDTGASKEQSLEPLGITTRAAATTYCIELSDRIRGRRREIATGVPVKITTAVDQALKDYFTIIEAGLGERTVRTYGEGITGHFEVWLGERGIKRVEEISPAHLAQFREWLKKRPLRAMSAGGQRGEREATAQKRSPRSINKNIEAVKALCNHWRRLGLAPALTRDGIADGLRKEPEPKRRPAFLKSVALSKLLKAALRHDAETFTMTRAEKLAGTLQSTPRYDPVAPFIAVVLLTGMRQEEALGLLWDRIDFDALDDRGKKSGEINLIPEDVKTKAARMIDLAVSPGLRRLLLALKIRAKGPYVLGRDNPLPVTLIESARKRLVADYGAPEFNWSQTQGSTPSLRATCATYLVNAPGIFGAGSSVWRAAKQLGHSPQVAERHYLGLVRGIPRDARTLEAAMGIESEIAKVIENVAGKGSRTRAIESA